MGRAIGAIGLREDFDGSALWRLARASKSAPQARRLLALAEIYDGGNRSDAARIGDVTLQIIRDWVIRFNARGPASLLDGKAPGKRSILNDQGNRFRLTAVLLSKMCGSVIPARLLGFGSRPWRRVRCWITFRR
jgi:hypothetical protein